jgi:hypothetical protein
MDVTRFLLPILTLLMLALPAPSFAEDAPKIKLGYAKCAHCTPMSLTPQFAEGVAIDAVGFNTGTDALTALVS